MSDDDRAALLVVDDDRFMQDFIADSLGGLYAVRCAGSGAEALELARQQPPALMLVDVQMPDMDGYALCREVKDDWDISDTPVLFLSALDGIEDRLRGFEVGGEDFVTKPVNPRILQAKVARVLALQQERHQLKSQAQYATTTAMTAMTSMSETGLLLEVMKRFNQCGEARELAQALQESLALFGVDGPVELLLADGDNIALNSRGPASELEISVLQHMAAMDRITQYKSRLSISYPHARLVVVNLPLDDPDRCGRLRDHLAMLLEAAEARLAAISSARLASSRGDAISGTIETLTQVLSDIDHKQRQGRADALTVLNGVLMRLEQSLVGLALTERQEEALLALVREGLEDVYGSQQAEAGYQDQLSAAVNGLQLAIHGGR
ncbi:two-component system response regulator [Vogesella sp. LIG4]|uniref:response regulator n=1 Tax=Vogesella sp. LIG4 TaxID=1192162 RepID=UPI00081FA268|nr:response regulator [Vogesella sp. LIG4]SCK18406.1 Response regulators consisting of a CheY-like receiver domain and a winged-helix DNA-binding domain [Vogesella sp. LIG4]